MADLQVQKNAPLVKSEGGTIRWGAGIVAVLVVGAAITGYSVGSHQLEKVGQVQTAELEARIKELERTRLLNSKASERLAQQEKEITDSIKKLGKITSNNFSDSEKLAQQKKAFIDARREMDRITSSNSVGATKVARMLAGR
jgi:uncharacterized protein HemX